MKRCEIWDLRDSGHYTYSKSSDITFISPSSFSELQGGFNLLKYLIASVYTSWYCHSSGVQEHLDLRIPSGVAQAVSPGSALCCTMTDPIVQCNSALALKLSLPVYVKETLVWQEIVKNRYDD